VDGELAEDGAISGIGEEHGPMAVMWWEGSDREEEWGRPVDSTRLRSMDDPRPKDKLV
jgi:hypothetical protein